MNLFDITTQLFGAAPNEFVQNLYYLFDIFLVLYVFRLIIMLFRSMFKIK